MNSLFKNGHYNFSKTFSKDQLCFTFDYWTSIEQLFVWLATAAFPTRCCHIFVARRAKPPLSTILRQSGQLLISMLYKLEHQTALCQLGTGLYCYWLYRNRCMASISSFECACVPYVCVFVCASIPLAAQWRVQCCCCCCNCCLLLLGVAVAVAVVAIVAGAFVAAARLTMCSALVHILLLNWYQFGLMPLPLWGH